MLEPMTVDTDRRTGRTTRMLKKALRATAGGGEAWVVVHVHAAIRPTRKMAAKIAKELGIPDAVKGLRFITPYTRDRELRGRLPSSEFWDHQAYEVDARPRANEGSGASTPCSPETKPARP